MSSSSNDKILSLSLSLSLSLALSLSLSVLCTAPHSRHHSCLTSVRPSPSFFFLLLFSLTIRERMWILDVLFYVRETELGDTNGKWKIFNFVIIHNIYGARQTVQKMCVQAPRAKRFWKRWVVRLVLKTRDGKWLQTMQRKLQTWTAGKWKNYYNFRYIRAGKLITTSAHRIVFDVFLRCHLVNFI